MDMRMNTASPADILGLIQSVEFPEILGPTPMDLAFAEKLHSLAANFEAWKGDKLVGIASAYLNRPETGIAYSPLFCSHPQFKGCGARLFMRMLHHCREAGFHYVRTDHVDSHNNEAIGFYTRLGGEMIQQDGRTLIGQVDLRKPRPNLRQAKEHEDHIRALSGP